MIVQCAHWCCNLLTDVLLDDLWQMWIRKYCQVGELCKYVIAGECDSNTVRLMHRQCQFCQYRLPCIQ